MQIKFQDVSFEYPTIDKRDTTALSYVTLDLSTRARTAIIGQTGSGKSTAMQHINGLLQPTTGSMHIDEYEITHKKNKYLPKIRQQIGYVFQNPYYQLFAATVLEDVMYGPLNFGMSETAANKAAIEALQLVGITEKLYEHYPFDLSGGQMRKVAIAGALAYQPHTLILDEPTVGLDPLAMQQLEELFLNLYERQQKSLIFITHDMEFVHRIAQRVVVFSQGTIVFDGTPHHLFSQPAILRQYGLEAPTIYQIIHGLQAQDASFQIDESASCQTIEVLITYIKKWQANKKQKAGK